jgi:hypothetical protein
MSKKTMSLQTRSNWIVDLTVLLGGLAAAISGIYFLFLPSGGYQGGRNPAYGVTILFTRHTWDDLHTWGGVAMIAAAVIHFAIHWPWVKLMARRTLNAKGANMSTGARLNVVLDAVVAVSFFVTVVSGLYFMLAPLAGIEVSKNVGAAAVLLSNTTWDLIHTWAGVVMIAAIAVHLWIHWRWVVNVTSRFFQSLWPQPKVNKTTAIANI